MTQKLRILTLSLCCLLICLTCTACGGSGGKVPDSYITQYFMDKFDDEYQEWSSKWSYSTDHSYDSSAHVDTVLVSLISKGEYGTCSFQIQLKYQYDKSSDLWSLIAESKWPENDERKYEFNDNLLDEWVLAFEIDHYDDWGVVTLNITSLDANTVTADCTLDFIDGYSGSGFTIKESGAYEINEHAFIERLIKISMQLPDGFKTIEYSDNNYSTEDIRLTLSIDRGVYVEYIAPVYLKD